MRILESLQDRVRERGELQRLVILGPETGAAHTSAVLVRLPPRHEFALHTHPRSEDCFFVLSGAGEAFGVEQRFPVAELTGVWIPAGAPHGLVAGSSGMLEIGFQSPPDPTAVLVEAPSGGAGTGGMLSASIPDRPGAEPVGWRPVFPERKVWRYLDPRYCVLDASQELRAEAGGDELIVVVARGAIELPQRSTRVRTIAALQLGAGEAVGLRALESSTLLLGIRALPAGSP